MGCGGPMGASIIKSLAECTDYLFILCAHSTSFQAPAAYQDRVIKTISFDCAAEEGLRTVFSVIEDINLSPDHLIYISGIHQQRNSTLKLTHKSIMNLFQINTIGAIYSSILFSRLPRPQAMPETQRTITIISSESGEYGGSGISVYASTKGAINTFVRGFSREVRQANIRINCISPGGLSASSSHDNQATLDRHGTYDDIAGCVKTILGKDSAYISGARISVSGGR